MERRPGLTMSVKTMGKLLGLKKVESYWLVNKKFFDTILVHGKMRIVVESFEYWYAGQIKYKKVDGPPPGERLKQESYSAKDIGQMLGVSTAHAYEIMKEAEVPYILVDYWRRFTKENFENWYKNQAKYVIREDRKKLEKAHGEVISMPEMARILDVPRSTVYSILNGSRNGEILKTVMIGRKRHVTKDSFDAWYESQDKYLKPEDQPEGYQRRKRYKDCLTAKKMKKQLAPHVSANPEYLTPDEAALEAGILTSTMRRWIQEKRFPVIRVSPKILRIPRREFEEYIEGWKQKTRRRR